GVLGATEEDVDHPAVRLPALLVRREQEVGLLDALVVEADHAGGHAAVVEEAAPEGVEAAALLGGRLARAHERDLALGGEVGEGVNEVGDFGQAREVGLAYGVVARLLGEGLASRR